MLQITLLFAILIMVLLLIILFEGVVMQLLRWGTFRQSIKAAAVMNLASVLVWLLMIGLVGQLGIIALLMGLLLSILIESAVLIRLEPGQTRYNIFVVIVANLVSYLVLLLPAFMFA